MSTVKVSRKVALRVFDLLRDGTRFNIVAHIYVNGALNVNGILDALGLDSQPAVSHHLALLRNADVLEPTRDGRSNVYDISDESRELIEHMFSVIDLETVQTPAKGKPTVTEPAPVESKRGRKAKVTT